MRSSLLVALGVGIALFWLTAIALVTLKLSAENPLIATAAVLTGLIGAGATYVVEVLTTPHE